eukprot:COSAG01_NODE_7437_length_3212_cov_2.628975_2_plen_185_part_00
MLWAATVCVVYIIVIPAVFFALLFRAARSDDGFDSRETERYGWFLLRYKSRCWWWEFVKLVQKTIMVGTGVFLSNLSMCNNKEKQCADGSVLGEDRGDNNTATSNIMCADGTTPVYATLDPDTGLCVAQMPGTPVVYTGHEEYPRAFIWSMAIIMITLGITLGTKLAREQCDSSAAVVCVRACV